MLFKIGLRGVLTSMSDMWRKLKRWIIKISQIIAHSASESMIKSKRYWICLRWTMLRVDLSKTTKSSPAQISIKLSPRVSLKMEISSPCWNLGKEVKIGRSLRDGKGAKSLLSIVLTSVQIKMTLSPLLRNVPYYLWVSARCKADQP